MYFIRTIFLFNFISLDRMCFRYNIVNLYTHYFGFKHELKKKILFTLPSFDWVFILDFDNRFAID